MSILLEKLWNNEITLEIVKTMISNSIEMYNKCLSLDLDFHDKCVFYVSFISDDIYEFDCISKFARTMIDLDINTAYWRVISDEIKKYNSYINENVKIYKSLIILSERFHERSQEYILVNKIIQSCNKLGMALKLTSPEKYQKLFDVNKKIMIIENKLIDDSIRKVPILKLSKDDVADIPSNVIDKYYNKDTMNYEIKLDRKMYQLCHKFIKNSNTRQKMDDVLNKTYNKNIPKLIYLFIYKHIKSNILGFDSYVDYVTNYSKNTIQGVLEKISVELQDRCNIELDVISKMKTKYENSTDTSVACWDIEYYINKWKQLYGINDNEISEYFELNNTIAKIFKILSVMFDITFVKCDRTTIEKTSRARKSMDVFRIYKNKLLVGEVTLDLFHRINKSLNLDCICINNRCRYPCKEEQLTPVSVVISMNLENTDITLLTLNDLNLLLNSFGKLIFYILSQSKYSLSGGSYTGVEIVDSFGKFIEFVFNTEENLKLLSMHYKQGNQLDDNLLKKIIHHRKLDYGISYKFKCFYGLFDLFVHSQNDFISGCKYIIKQRHEEQEENGFINEICCVYDSFFETIFNTHSTRIMKETEHFQPILWSYLFNGCENIYFMKVLSDIFAFEFFRLYRESASNPDFCKKISSFITSSIIKNSFNLKDLSGQTVPINQMFKYFELNNNDAELSLYNIDITNTVLSPRNEQVKQKRKIQSPYVSTDVKNIENNKLNKFEQVSESDPKIRQMLDKIMIK